jgi:hypothetical protein
MAATLWTAVAHAQVFPSSGPGSTIPVSPDDTPLVRRTDDPLRTAGLITAMPGPSLPNPNDPTKWVRLSPDQE